MPLLALAIAGCGTSGSSTSTTAVDATGSTLHVVLSDPPAIKANAALQDVVEAEQLAWTEQVGSVKNVALKLSTLSRSVSDNARAAIEDNSLITYVGEVQTGQSRQTVGITNAEDVLELSPTDTVAPIKNDFESFSSYGRTFASLPLQLTTSPAALAKADPGFARSFRKDFDHAPSAQAILGYDAVWTLLRVIKAAGASANNRTRIAASVIATLKANSGQTDPASFTIKLK